MIKYIPIISTFLFINFCQSQLNGIYTVPGSYASVSAAFISLNAVGVSENVTFKFKLI